MCSGPCRSSTPCVLRGRARRASALVASERSSRTDSAGGAGRAAPGWGGRVGDFERFGRRAGGACAGSPRSLSSAERRRDSIRSRSASSLPARAGEAASASRADFARPPARRIAAASRRYPAVRARGVASSAAAEGRRSTSAVARRSRSSGPPCATVSQRSLRSSGSKRSGADSGAPGRSRTSADILPAASAGVAAARLRPSAAATRARTVPGERGSQSSQPRRTDAITAGVRARRAAERSAARAKGSERASREKRTSRVTSVPPGDAGFVRRASASSASHAPRSGRPIRTPASAAAGGGRTPASAATTPRASAARTAKSPGAARPSNASAWPSRAARRAAASASSGAGGAAETRASPAASAAARRKAVTRRTVRRGAGRARPRSPRRGSGRAPRGRSPTWPGCAPASSRRRPDGSARCRL